MISDKVVEFINTLIAKTTTGAVVWESYRDSRVAILAKNPDLYVWVRPNGVHLNRSRADGPATWFPLDPYIDAELQLKLWWTVREYYPTLAQEIDIFLKVLNNDELTSQPQSGDQNAT